MGIFDKIKDIFAKSSLESLQDLEKKIQVLHGKAIFSEVVALIGIGGRLKGLPLVYSVKEEKEFKALVARLSELINPLNDLESTNELIEFLIIYKGLYVIFISIKENIGFLGSSPIMDDITVFREWINKNMKDLISLFDN